MDLTTLFEMDCMLEAQFRQPRLMYHGTSSTFLRTILKQGVIPDPTKKRWDDDDQESQHSFSRTSLPGSYWASNMMTASSAASNTTRKFGGQSIIVIAEIAEQSAYADEDNINAPLQWAVSDTVQALHPGIRSDFWPALGTELFDGDAAKRNQAQSVFIDKLHQHLKGHPKHVPDRTFFDKLLDALVMRSMAFEKKQGMRLEHWMTKVPDLPTIREIEQQLLALRDQLTRSYRVTAFYSEDKFNHTLRMPTVVGFRGGNRIRWIITEQPWHWDKQDSGDSTLMIDPMILSYGQPPLPEDFLNQYTQRVGKFPGLIDSHGQLLVPSEREEIT